MYLEFTEGARQVCLHMRQLCQDSHPRLLEPALSKATSGSVSSQFCSPLYLTGPSLLLTPIHPLCLLLPASLWAPLPLTFSPLVATCPQLCACVPNLKYLNPRCHLYPGPLCPRETSFELPQKSSLGLWSGPSQASSHSGTQDLWGCPSAGDSI